MNLLIRRLHPTDPMKWQDFARLTPIGEIKKASNRQSFDALFSVKYIIFYTAAQAFKPEYICLTRPCIRFLLSSST